MRLACPVFGASHRARGGIFAISCDIFWRSSHYWPVSSNKKLFRAVVVLGAALTSSACDDDRCHKCSPTPDAVANNVDAATHTDAGVDAEPDAFIAIL